jgi:MFS transporter, FSR family, fosmidomycin resistance protein
VTSARDASAAHEVSLPGAAWLGGAHLVVDAVCVTTVLRAAPASDSLVASALWFVLAYDVLAFAGQVPLGWFVDRFDLRRGAAVLGILLAAAGLVVGSAAGSLVVLLAGLGNALFHLGAGAMVLAGGKDKAAPAGVFVAPGALGLGIGLLLGRRFVTAAAWPWFFALAAAVVVVMRVSTRSTPTGEVPRSAPPLQPSALVAIASLLCVSVAVRSLVGAVGCDACDKTLFLAIAVPCAGCAGKLVGGFLADRFGWIDLSMVALVAAAPLLAFSGGDLWLALPGLFLFQMTMPVTLVAVYRLMPRRPALAFGLPCLALIAGALPAYLPDLWRPRGLAVLALVTGSAAVLFLALRRLLSHPPLPVAQRSSR